MDEKLVRKMFALLNRAGVTDRGDRLTLMSAILHRPIDSTNDCTDIEIRGIVDTLDYWKVAGELQTRTFATVAAEKRLIEKLAGDGQEPSETQSSPAVPGTNPEETQMMQDSRNERIMMHDTRGHQLVEVQFDSGDGTTFTYAWGGEGELQIGDRVQTPPAWWLPEEDAEYVKLSAATVTALGSDYPGTITLLTKKIEEKHNEV